MRTPGKDYRKAIVDEFEAHGIRPAKKLVARLVHASVLGQPPIEGVKATIAAMAKAAKGGGDAEA